MVQQEYLQRNIEKLRSEINQLVRIKGKCEHPSIVEKSKLLDKYIVKYKVMLHKKSVVNLNCKWI